MRQVVCTRARLGVPLGSVAEIGDDAEVSPLYYADAGSPEANAAQARAAQDAPSAPPAEPDTGGQPPPDVPVTPLAAQPLTVAPDATAGE